MVALSLTWAYSLYNVILLDWKVDVDAAVDVVSEDCGFGSED